MFKKVAFLICTCAFVSVPGMAIAEEQADLTKYAQSGSSLSAIASAVSLAGPCSVPLVFEETKDGSDLILGVHCRGAEEDEVSVFIRFMDDGFSLLPKSFEYAG